MPRVAYPILAAFFAARVGDLRLLRKSYAIRFTRAGTGFGGVDWEPRMRSRRRCRIAENGPRSNPVKSLISGISERSMSSTRTVASTSNSRFCCSVSSRIFSPFTLGCRSRGDNANYLLLLIASNCIHHEQNTNASCGPNRNVSLLCVAVLLVASVDDIRIIEDQGCGLETHPVFANIRLILLGIPFKFNSGKRGSKTNKL